MIDKLKADYYNALGKDNKKALQLKLKIEDLEGEKDGKEKKSVDKPL